MQSKLFFAVMFVCSMISFHTATAFADVSAVGYQYRQIFSNDFPKLGKAGVYNYAPSIMKDGGLYKAWWCGGPSDRIYYSTSANLDGPWSEPITVLSARGTPTTGNESNFDNAGPCDPSVIKIDNKYYMYHTGYPSYTKPVDNGPINTTKIGVASSDDGIRWTRLNSGKLIITPKLAVTSRSPYGAGHPSISFANGKYYLLFTDSTGLDANGTGQFVMRSTDPTFQANVEERQYTGWVTLSKGETHSTTFAPIRDAINVDWAFVPQLNQFAVAINGLDKALSVRFYSADVTAQVKATQNILGNWTEGPGLVKEANASIVARNNLLMVNLYRSVGCKGINSSWKLALAGMELHTNSLLSQTTYFKQPAAYDFDSNGISDRTVWRPKTGTWYIRLDSGHTCTQQWGAYGDIPVAGNYKVRSTLSKPDDLDANPYGQFLPAVYRPSTGQWLVFAQPFIATPVQYGLNGDVPVPGDYDRDGRMDFAVWRPSEGRWYVRGIKNVQWGLPGDSPVPLSSNVSGAEITVWRPSNGTWYYQGSGASHQFGLPGDIPIANPSPIENSGYPHAVWRPSTGQWIFPSVPNKVVQFGLPGDVPVVGDFDGDGSHDIAVWRPSTGTWYTKNQADSGKAPIQWGLPDDIPVNIPPSVFQTRFR